MSQVKTDSSDPSDSSTGVYKKHGFIAFYAPLKSPSHPVVSGDREIARAFAEVLCLAGFDVVLASEFRSFSREGGVQQAELIEQGREQAARLLSHYLQVPTDQRPMLWLTYHLYHKAPDLFGPVISKALNIPYVIIEASYNPKHSQGPWREGLAESKVALEQAQLILVNNPKDHQPLTQAGVLPKRCQSFPAFIDTRPFNGPRKQDRARLAAQWQVSESVTWLVTVAMMRSGDKLKSYQTLIAALSASVDSSWVWWIIGDGESEAELRQLVMPFAERVVFLGRQDKIHVAKYLRQMDAFVWPAHNEALGLAMMEAQAAGVPVVTADRPGVRSVCHPEGAIFIPPTAAAYIQELPKILRTKTLQRMASNHFRAAVLGFE